MIIDRKYWISRLHDEKDNFINPHNLKELIPAFIEKIKASNFLKENSTDYINKPIKKIRS